MSRITALSLDNTAESVRPALQGVQKMLGFVPNTFTTLAHSPAVLNSFFQFSQAMGKVSLSERQKQVVALATSEVNGCDYCVAAHSVFAQKAGLTYDEIQAARSGQLDTLAGFARLVTQTRGLISDAQLADARHAGLSDAQIVEIIAQVTLLTFTNYLNNVAGTDNDWPAITK